MLNNLFLNLNSWWRMLYMHQHVRDVHTLWTVHAMVFGGQTCRFTMSLKVLSCPLSFGVSPDGGG
jgi:CRISPR/Cas system CMR-associated protein Cmr1 (group 7 of RAMP superfamily)